MRGALRWFGSSVLVAVTILACGSRTGLLVDEECIGVDCTQLPDAQKDVTGDQTLASDAPRDGTTDLDVTTFPDGPIFEGGALDVNVTCPDPPYCAPDDPDYIYRCGVRVFACSSIEQCQQVGGDGQDGGDAGVGQCVNPCLDTLGQDSSNGCEFYAAEMDTDDTTKGSCYAVFIVNQWKTGEPARIAVERNGVSLPIADFARIPVGKGTGISYAPYDPAKGLGSNQIAILFLSRDPSFAGGGSNPNNLASCPAGVTPAVVGDASLRGTGVGSAFHIQTNVPVVAYQMFPYGGGRARVTSATLLLPTNVWDTGFVTANAYTKPNFGMSGTPASDAPTMMVLASTNNTHVTINPVVAIAGGGTVGGTPANKAITYTVQRGSYLQFTQDVELTGSTLVADHPVALVAGSTTMQVPVGRVRADSGQQMLPGIRALGSEYVGVRFRERRNRPNESDPWRIIGAVNGTTLTWEPSVPVGAPTTIDARQFVEFDSPGGFVVRSQDAAHPFHMAAYMTGGDVPPFTSVDNQVETEDDGEGDPEFVNVIPPAQFLPHYTFFTDPTYPETNLVIIRVKDGALGIFPDVTLDCAGLLAGWQPVGTGGLYEFVRVDLSTGIFKGVGACDNGVHTIDGKFPGVEGGTSTARFGVTVWGWGNTLTATNDDSLNPLYSRWVSYAYPAGANFATLNNVVLHP